MPVDRDLIERFAQFLRAAMALGGDQRRKVDYVLQMELLDLIDDAPAAAVVAEVDSELVSMVRERYQVWLDS